MSSEIFWDLTWYDWSLWNDKIINDHNKRIEDFELECIRISHLQALIANCNRDAKTKPTPFEATDFYKPSWLKTDIIEEISDEEILKKYPKTLNG